MEDFAQIQERLLDVASRRSPDKAYEGLSPSQIVEPAAIARTTLYSRRDFKDAPLRAITLRQVKRQGTVATLTSSLPMDLSRTLMVYANRTLALSLAICWS
ncbi:hypothetical protein HNO88_003995 [Novosphingobium chloroacetimidivorans]|uniref:Uncharacterized protein n=1 Tax=Novosphingobium chloroacetimidivorans TaxID=1428314 RepID=A0A7W7KD96_9SPHN|nr:hypothetical protein [Novosphingobium chloroacetimidivorans]MBB4860651.1 hypothetical protein [Novosphingobium chloroacetimidivorans]